jgi:alkylhydroperoxidase family enzyme
MTRITRVTTPPEELRSLYERERGKRGHVPAMFESLAHRPAILETMVAHLDAVTGTGTVPLRTKELVATLVSRINACHY